MKTQELIDAISADNGLTKADGRKIVDQVFESIAAALANGDEVAIGGFGKFSVKNTPAREGRNPSTGATIQIAAGRKVGFTVAKGLKDRVSA